MKIEVNLTENNSKMLKRKYQEYRAITKDNITMPEFYSLVFLHGLAYLNGGFEKNAFGKIVGGEIIEYR